MRLPRDISGQELAQSLSAFGYQISRITGSHMRLTTQQGGEHHLTVPAHANLRVGTLASIISDVAMHIGKNREDLIRALFKQKFLRAMAEVPDVPPDEQDAP